jgi:hypothetical protein
MAQRPSTNPNLISPFHQNMLDRKPHLFESNGVPLAGTVNSQRPMTIRQGLNIMKAKLLKAVEFQQNGGTLPLPGSNNNNNNGFGNGGHQLGGMLNGSLGGGGSGRPIPRLGLGANGSGGGSGLNNQGFGQNLSSLSGNDVSREEPPFGPVDAVFTWVANTPEHAELRRQYLQMVSQSAPNTRQQVNVMNARQVQQGIRLRVNPQQQQNAQTKKANTVALADNGNNRYADHDELKYALRSIYKNAPWFRRIYLIVQDGQSPTWLIHTSDECPIPVYVVPHSMLYGEDYAPHLPTFNSQSIEAHLHRLPDLAEHFLYFNDDMMIANPMHWSTLWTAEGRPIYTMSGMVPTGPKISTMSKHQMAWINNGTILNKLFSSSRAEQREYPMHQACPMLKSSFEEIWALDGLRVYIEQTSAAKFRSTSDLYIVGFLVYWNIYKQKGIKNSAFRPSSMVSHFYHEVKDNSDPVQIFREVILRKPTLMCVNDMILKNRVLGLFLQTGFDVLFPEMCPAEVGHGEENNELLSIDDLNNGGGGGGGFGGMNLGSADGLHDLSSSLDGLNLGFPGQAPPQSFQQQRQQGQQFQQRQQQQPTQRQQPTQQQQQHINRTTLGPGHGLGGSNLRTSRPSGALKPANLMNASGSVGNLLNDNILQDPRLTSSGNRR